MSPKPDLIVLDIGLPGLNGIEVARRIRKLSPESKTHLSQMALNLGAQGYVVKATAGADLLALVDALFRGLTRPAERVRTH